MDKKLRKIIGANLQAERKKQHYTQLQVATRSKLSANHYAKIERGEVMPNLLTLINILKTLDVSATEILEI
jgi:transcriptional regulator with XRE-family HTH domain